MAPENTHPEQITAPSEDPTFRGTPDRDLSDLPANWVVSTDADKHIPLYDRDTGRAICISPTQDSEQLSPSPDVLPNNFGTSPSHPARF